MRKRTLTQGLRLVLAFCVAISMLTGCGKPKPPQLLPPPEPPTAEAKPEHKPHPVVWFAVIATMLPALIIMKHPTPMLALRATTAWVFTPKHLVRIVGTVGIIGSCVYGMRAKLRKRKEEAR